MYQMLRNMFAFLKLTGKEEMNLVGNVLCTATHNTNNIPASPHNKRKWQKENCKENIPLDTPRGIRGKNIKLRRARLH